MRSTAATPASLTTLQHQRTLAIERHRARSAAAWALHDQLRATLDPFLARLSERLLLHTQYPDDADHVSMSTLELAGGPLSPAFRAMYHMLPSIIGGLTRTLALALAERADLQIDRLLGILPPPAPRQPAGSQAASTSSTPPTQEEAKPRPTSADYIRAAHAARIAEEDAYVIPRLTQHERDLIRLYCALPDPLPDGPMESWNIKVDPNAPLTRWREVLLPHGRRLDDPYIPCDLDDDPDDDPDPDPTPPSGTGGKNSGKNSGKPSGNQSGNATGKSSGTHRAPSRPHHRAPTRSRTTNGGDKDARLTMPTNVSGKHSGKNIGNDSGNASGNATAPHPAPTSPEPNLRRQISGLSAAKPSGAVSTAGFPTANEPTNHTGNISGNDSGNDSGNPTTLTSDSLLPDGTLQRQSYQNEK